MIIKERLKELIEQGATVYSKYNTFNLNPASSKFVITYGAFNNKEYLVVGSLAVDLEDLYEHKADAEWDLEFGKGSVVRNEELSIKTFKEVETMGTGDINIFKTVHNNEILFGKSKLNGKWELIIYNQDNSVSGKSSLIFEKVFNKENYTEACRLIKKLFMGEE